MNLLFIVDYRVHAGECLAVLIDGKPHAMHCADGYTHRLNLSISKDFFYQYVVLGADAQIVRREESSAVRFLAHVASASLQLHDCWQDRPTLRPEATVAFRLCCPPAATEDRLPTPRTGSCQFVLHAPLPADPRLTYALVGNLSSFGAWQGAGARPLHRSADDLWQLTLQPADAGLLQYKYVLLDITNRHIVAWEDGPNRTITLPPATACRFDDGRPRLQPERPHMAGMVIPLFSLRSEQSWGIGDLADLERLVAWARRVGMRAIQLLPINDTTRTHTWTDSYPYNCVSVMALHPLYADLSPLLACLTDAERAVCLKRREELNALPQVDYEGVEKLKLGVLRKAYERTFPHVSRTKSYRAFVAEHESWLQPYAAFCYLRDCYGTADFRCWPKLRRYSRKGVTELLKAKEARNGVNFFCFIQFVLFEQMERVHSKAQQTGLILKGDLPIGISRDSVPAWVDGKLFNFSGQAGAPPDDFACEGQNWGFPTYRWDVMALDDYAWWQRRLGVMQRCFDAYRIDHVLGFFRIWQIPYGRTDGLLGHFEPALPLSRAEWQAAGVNLSDEAIYRSHLNLHKPACEVLVIEDDHQKDHFHPAIAAQKSRPYQAMSAEERQNFDRVYEDYFYHRHETFWAASAKKKLPALLRASRMLPCAEDLGMVPACVGPLLKALQILTLQIERMPKTSGCLFDATECYPYLSVATADTHDMPPMRLWWSQNADLAQCYFNEVLHFDGPAPHDMTPELAEAVVRRHLKAPSMLCLLSFQDWTAIDPHARSTHPEEEQINNPANAQQYWRYRMHLTIEALEAETALNEKIRSLIASAGR